MSARIDTFGIALPPEWVRIPLDDDFESFVRTQRERIGDGLSRTGRRQFELMMRQLRNDCVRADVRLAGALFAALEDDAGCDPDGETGAALLSASCTISVVTRASMGSELPLTVNTIAAAMAREPASEDGVEIVNLDPPAIVDLHTGPAVKLVRLHTFPPHSATLARRAVFSQHVLVPFDEGERAAVVSFTTPTTAYAKPLSELFDAMMHTFRSFAGDEVTDPVPVR